MDNLWLNASWLLCPLWTIAALISAFAVPEAELRTGLVFTLGSAVLVYAYVLPVLASRLVPVRPDVRIRDWLALPAAIAFKSAGPMAFVLMYCVSRLRGTQVRFSKVER